MKNKCMFCILFLLLVAVTAKAGLWDPPIANPSFELVGDYGTWNGWGYMIDDWYSEEAFCESCEEFSVKDESDNPHCPQCKGYLGGCW